MGRQMKHCERFSQDTSLFWKVGVDFGVEVSSRVRTRDVENRLLSGLWPELWPRRFYNAGQEGREKWAWGMDSKWRI